MAKPTNGGKKKEIEPKRRFLFGKAEQLIEQAVRPKSGGGEKNAPYTLETAIARLSPMIDQTATDLWKLPEEACVDDCATIAVTMHPRYISRSSYPTGFVRKVGGTHIGTRNFKITPEATGTSFSPSLSDTTQLLLSVDRIGFLSFRDAFDRTVASQIGASDLPCIERIDCYTPEMKIRPIRQKGVVPCEVALHRIGTENVLHSFQVYLETLNIETFPADKIFTTPGLFFLPLIVPSDKVRDVAMFSHLRVLRAVPKLRIFKPNARALDDLLSIPCIVDNSEASGKPIVGAIFDGGLPLKPDLSEWVSEYYWDDEDEPDSELLEHGLAVTSAALFGPISETGRLKNPNIRIDHYQVLTSQSLHQSSFELFNVLKRIEEILREKTYDFVNISIGPKVAIEDEDVHVWTSILDDVLSHGQTVATIAVGNEGHLAAPHDRIQPPADCVNGLAVGACDSEGKKWDRALYSSIGPGRCPGLVKPDLVAFGGDEDEPFNVLIPHNDLVASGVTGTSFSAPYVMHTAMQLASQMREQVDALSIRALLINRSEAKTRQHRNYLYGWGRLRPDIDQLLLCDANEARMVYRGFLEPGRFLKIPIPLPDRYYIGEKSMEISATLCFACDVEANNPDVYTKCGLEISFYPDSSRFEDPSKAYPIPSDFFGSGSYRGENKLRREFYKWETVRHAKKSVEKGVRDPFFTLNYIARESGHKTPNPEVIPYALVINVRSETDFRLYDQVKSRYAQQLAPMQPRIRPRLQQE